MIDHRLVGRRLGAVTTEGPGTIVPWQLLADQGVGAGVGGEVRGVGVTQRRPDLQRKAVGSYKRGQWLSTPLSTFVY